MGENQDRELTQEELIEEAIQKAYEDTIFPIELTEEQLSEHINSEDFTKGQNMGNFFAGMYTQMINFGMMHGDILDVMLSYMTAENNLEVQKLNLEIARVNSSNSEKNNF